MASASRDDNTVPGLIVTDATLGGDLVVSGDDYTNAQAVHVAIVDGSGNQVTSFGGSGGTSHGDDAAFTIGSASSITPMGALADETTPDSVDEGDVGVPRMTLDRILKVQGNDLLTPNGDSVMDDTNDAVQVNVVAGSTSGTEYTEDDAAPANPDAPALSLVRDDALSSQTTADGDIVTARGTDKGEIYVKHADDVTIADGGNTITVDGTVTANLSATDNAVLDSIQTAVETIDNAISGSEMQVDVIASLPAGDNNIGNVDIASSVALDVSAATVTVDTEMPAAAALTDGTANPTIPAVGSMNHVYNGTNWDRLRGDTSGLNISDISAGTQTNDVKITLDSEVVSIDDNSGSITVDGTVTANLGATDNAVLDQIEVNTSYGDNTGGGTEAGALRVTIANNSTGVLSVDDNGGSLTVDGTVTANLSSTDNTVLDNIQTAVETIDNAISGSEMQVDVVASLPAGSNAIGKLAANSGVDIGDVDVTSLPSSTNTIEVVGDVAHDAAASGNPNIIAGVAQDADDTAPPNRVSAEGDATRVATDFDGAVFTRPHPPQIWDYHLDTSTAQTDTTVHSAPGAGLSLYVTDIVFSSNDATAINLFFEESTTKVLGPYYLEAVAGRGMALHFSTPKKITANTALTLTTSASIAHSVDVTGYVAQG